MAWFVQPGRVMRLLRHVSVALIAFAIGLPAAHGAQLQRVKQKQMKKTKMKTRNGTTRVKTKEKTKTKAVVKSGDRRFSQRRVIRDGNRD